jgi:uncharacterized protein (DUF2336 family)
MIIRRFMQWAATASATERAVGAGALARAYLYSDLSDADLDDAEIALTALLDDASPVVRKALADVFAASAGAPPAIILALANDQSDIAAPVLSLSPLLTDAQLIDCAAIGDAFAQAAIAIRPVVAPPVAAALAEVGHREALVALAVNPGANIPDFSARRMVSRFGTDAELREALLSRDALAPVVRSDLVAATARALAAFVGERGWMSGERIDRLVHDSCDRAVVTIASDVEADSDWAGARALVAHLRQSAQLTVGLMLRALLSGNICLFEAALVELSGLPERRTLGLARQSRGAGLAVLFRAAGIHASLLPAFEAALAARAEFDDPAIASARLSRAMIHRTLAACETMPASEAQTLLVLLRRFEAEAARDNARDAMLELRTPVMRIAFGAVDGPFDAPRITPPTRGVDIDLAAFEAELVAA